jgi:hypothetical protein
VHRTRTLASIVAVPLLALLIACGGGDDDNPPSNGGSSNNNEPRATQAPSGGSGGQPQATQPSGGGTSGSSNDDLLEDCPEIQALILAAGGGFSGATLDDVELNAEFFNRLARSSPSEIRSDMQLFANAMGKFFETLNRLNVDITNPASFARLTPAQIEELEKASAALDTPELERAMERIDAYFTRACS